MENDLRFHWQIARFSLDMEAIAGGRDKKSKTNDDSLFGNIL